MLRLSRVEMSESAFKDGVVDQIYDGIINYLSVESASIGYPELIVPATLQVGTWVLLGTRTLTEVLDINVHV